MLTRKPTKRKMFRVYPLAAQNLRCSSRGSRRRRHPHGSMHAREVCLVLLCAIHVSSGLLLSPSPALSPLALRALPRRVRVSHLVAAEEDDLLASFRQSTEPTKDQALKQAESLRDDDEPEILEPTLQELVAKMPQYEKVRRHASALLFSSSRLSRASPCPTGHHRSRYWAVLPVYRRLGRPLIHACTETPNTAPPTARQACSRRNTVHCLSCVCG